MNNLRPEMAIYLQNVQPIAKCAAYCFWEIGYEIITSNKRVDVRLRANYKTLSIFL